MEMPAEYVGREQSYLKHRVLEQYLLAWAQKQGSNSKYREVQLVYVDCFAGPWKSKDQDLRDTSVHIGLSALESAAHVWKTNIKVKAVFVEKEDEPFARLYRQRLKDEANLPYAANLAVVHPTQNRTWFHLVVGGHHHEVLRLFRSVESKVCGREADAVRAGARARGDGRTRYCSARMPHSMHATTPP